GAGGAPIVATVGLERAGEREAEIDGAGGVGLGVGEDRHGGHVARCLSRAAREIARGLERGRGGRREREGLEARVERLRRAAEVLVVEARELLQQRGAPRSVGLGGELALEGAREDVVALPRAEDGEEAIALGLALARRLERGLQVLGGAI